MAGGSRKGSNRTRLNLEMLSFLFFSFLFFFSFCLFLFFFYLSPEAFVLFSLGLLVKFSNEYCHVISAALSFLFCTGRSNNSITNIVALSHSVHVKLATVSRTGAIGQSARYISLVQATGRLQAAQTTE